MKPPGASCKKIRGKKKEDSCRHYRKHNADNSKADTENTEQVKQMFGYERSIAPVIVLCQEMKMVNDKIFRRSVNFY